MFTTYDIFNDINNLRSLVNTFFRDLPETGRRNADFPLINIVENKDDHIRLSALLPGVDRKDLKIELNDTTLTLEGERKSDVEKDRHYIRKERSFGKFARAIRLPYPVKSDTIQASLKNGVLFITLEKSEEAKPKKIEIK